MASTPATPSDQELARQTQAGSLAAFEALVHRYERRIYGFVRNSCWNEADAVEITQDTFVKAFQSIHRYESKHEFSTWLFTIARRKAIDFHRRASRALAAVAFEPPEEANPSEIMVREEQGKEIWDLARRILSQRQFQALWLQYVEELPVAQIAQALGLTRVHSKVLLFRARQILARHLEAPEQGHEPARFRDPTRKLVVIRAPAQDPLPESVPALGTLLPGNKSVV